MQLDLTGISDPHPREITVTGGDLIARLDELQRAGATVESLSRVNGSNSGWLLRLQWPEDDLLPQ